MRLFKILAILGAFGELCGLRDKSQREINRKERKGKLKSYTWHQNNKLILLPEKSVFKRSDIKSKKSSGT